MREQWQRDIAEFGHIKFIEQSFDGFPGSHGRQTVGERRANPPAHALASVATTRVAVAADGYGGGFGDFCHRPDLRSGPGYWERLGYGKDELPHAVGWDSVPTKPVRAVSPMRVGTEPQPTSNRVMKLTRAANGLANLSVRHHSRHDRSGFPFPGDTAISSGSCVLDFWLFRPDAKSACVVTLQYDHDPAHRHNVAIYAAGGDPAPIHFTQDGKYVASTATLGVNKWQRLTLKVDLEHRTYSAETLAEDAARDPVAQAICRDVPYAAQFNAFNMIEFSPQGATGSVFYLDDVSLRWMPTPNFEPLGKEPLLQASFESMLRDRWTLREGQSTDITIDNDISYGHELQSLRMRGSGGRVQFTAPSMTWQPDGLLLVDADIFLRSTLPYVQMTPGSNVTSADEVGLALVSTGDDKPLIELRTHHATWHHRDGDKLIDTKVPAAFDAWNHLQLAIDPQTKTCRVILQVIGAAPRELCRSSLTRIPATDSPLAVELFCQRSQPQPDGPGFDNLRVTHRVRIAK